MCPSWGPGVIKCVVEYIKEQMEYVSHTHIVLGVTQDNAPCICFKEDHPPMQVLKTLF
jgi:hypothetical protein